MKQKQNEIVICDVCKKVLKLSGILMNNGYSVKHYYCSDCKKVKRKTA